MMMRTLTMDIKSWEDWIHLHRMIPFIKDICFGFRKETVQSPSSFEQHGFTYIEILNKNWIIKKKKQDMDTIFIQFVFPIKVRNFITKLDFHDK